MFPVSQKITPAQVKSVISYGVRRLRGDKLRTTEPLNLSKELCELELNVLPSELKHRRTNPEPEPEYKSESKREHERLSKFSDLAKSTEGRSCLNPEESAAPINIQECIKFNQIFPFLTFNPALELFLDMSSF